MSTPYIGEIRMFAGTFAPLGWAFCAGQSLPVDQYEALYTLIGTTYGGDGVQSFLLPNLQSRVPMHMGNSTVLGEPGGAETVTINTSTLATHSHAWFATTSAAQNATPVKNAFAMGTATVYSTQSPSAPMNDKVVSISQGGNQPHENIQPYISINYIISLFGTFPPHG